MRRLWLLLLLCVPILPAAAQNGHISGFGPPTALSPVPSCITNTIYVDRGTGLVWTAQGAPCAWQPASTVVTPEQYGAVGNGNRVFDAYTAMPGTGGMMVGVTGPPITTQAPGAVVDNIFIAYPATWATKPTGGTTRIDEATTVFTVLLLEQSVPTPTTLAPLTGKQTAVSGWQALRISLQPGATYVNSGYADHSGTTLTLSSPSGTAAGNYMFSCAAASSGMTMTPSSGWVSIGFEISPTTTFTVNYETTQCWQHIADGGSDDTNTITLSVNAVATGMIATYSGTAGPEGYAANTLQSATANWTAADVNKSICVQRAGAFSGANWANPVILTKQQCGTIAGYLGTTNGVSRVQLSFTPTSRAVSGVEASWVTDDSVAINNMYNTAPCTTVGCVATFGCKMYGVNSPVTIPLAASGTSIITKGCGIGMPWSAESVIALGALPPQPNVSGTQLVAETTSLSGTLLTVGGVKDVVPANSATVIQNITLVAGAGWMEDGGGADALDTLNLQNIYLDKVGFANFNAPNAAWYVDGVTPDSGQYAYVTGATCTGCRASFIHGPFLKIGGASGVPNLENINVRDSEIEANYGPAVDMANANIQGFIYEGNLSQWNNQGAAAADIKLESGAVCIGCVVPGNYFELDPVMGGQSNAVMTNAAGGIGTVWSSNYIIPYSAPRHLTFSAAGTAIPACSATSIQLNQASACVSDSTACTNGTTYTSGGSTACQVQCSGGAWKETGASTGCN